MLHERDAAQGPAISGFQTRRWSLRATLFRCVKNKDAAGRMFERPDAPLQSGATRGSFFFFFFLTVCLGLSYESFLGRATAAMGFFLFFFFFLVSVGKYGGSFGLSKERQREQAFLLSTLAYGLDKLRLVASDSVLWNFLSPSPKSITVYAL